MNRVLILAATVFLFGGCTEIGGINLNPISSIYEAWNESRIISFLLSHFWWLGIVLFLFFMRGAYREWLNNGVDRDGKINTSREIIATITYIIMFALLVFAVILFAYQGYVN